MKDASTFLPVLQFVAIQRRDTKEWAIPGVSETLTTPFYFTLAVSTRPPAGARSIVSALAGFCKEFY